MNKDIKNNLTRWISTLHSIQTSMLYHCLDEKPSHNGFIDIAEQLEFLAKNIRERSQNPIDKK